MNECLAFCTVYQFRHTYCYPTDSTLSYGLKRFGFAR
nr:MAG TPA: hypothetical protein [Caudoviricetes sp.]